MERSPRDGNKNAVFQKIYARNGVVHSTSAEKCLRLRMFPCIAVRLPVCHNIHYAAIYIIRFRSDFGDLFGLT